MRCRGIFEPKSEVRRRKGDVGVRRRVEQAFDWRQWIGLNRRMPNRECRMMMEETDRRISRRFSRRPSQARVHTSDFGLPPHGSPIC
jgi:hypothetical protein